MFWLSLEFCNIDIGVVKVDIHNIQTPATRKIGTRLDAYINKINKILAVFFVLNK